MANKKPTPIVEETTEEIIAPVEPVVNEEPNYLVVTADKLNVRKEPSKDAKILTIVSKNEKLLMNTKKLFNGFHSITTSSSIEGYVMKEFVERQ